MCSAPSYCQYCRKQGHEEVECRNKATYLMSKASKKEQKSIKDIQETNDDEFKEVTGKKNKQTS